MHLTINLRHLENKSLHLVGEWPVAELNLDIRDELVQINNPLNYDLSAERHGNNIFVNGRLELVLDCECIRCLKKFQHTVRIPKWTCNLPLEGEDQVTIENDCVDLTPFVRDDILLAFPQHPLCDRKCSGLHNTPLLGKNPCGVSETRMDSSAWAELDKLKF